MDHQEAQIPGLRKIISAAPRWTYRPPPALDCSKGYAINQPERVWDNGWILELDMDVIRNHASTFGMDAGELTASWVFDRGYVTWAGITPDDTVTRNRERDEIQELAKIDLLAYIKAMKEWGINREKRFINEGWRKMKQLN